MNQPELLSIIIPVYNVEAYIEKCVDSILGQSFGEFGVYIIDDCSTDATVAILSGYAARDPRIHVVEKTHNSGPSASRNMGIDMAKGKYITFVDGDDWYVSAEALKVMYAAAVENDADCVCCGYETLHNVGTLKKRFHNSCLGKKTARQFAEDRIRTNLPAYHYVWNKLYRAETIRSNHIRFSEGKHSAEDVEFNEFFLQYMQSAVVLPECFYGYNCLNMNSLTKISSRTGAAPTEAEEQRAWGMWQHILRERESRVALYTGIDGTEKSFAYIDRIAYMFGIMVLRSVKDPSLREKLEADPAWQEIQKKLGAEKIVLCAKVWLNRQTTTAKAWVKALLNMVRR